MIAIRADAYAVIVTSASTVTMSAWKTVIQLTRGAEDKAATGLMTVRVMIASTTTLLVIVTADMPRFLSPTSAHQGQHQLHHCQEQSAHTLQIATTGAMDSPVTGTTNANLTIAGLEVVEVNSPLSTTPLMMPWILG